MAKLEIFISHTSKESEMAQLIKKFLIKDFPEDLDIFISSDLSTIKAGENWLDEVYQSLKSAQIIMVLISPESLDRPWINFEAGAGWIREIPVIPICHSGLTLIDLPIPLNLFQAIEPNKGSHLLKLYDSISNSIQCRTPVIDYEIMAKEVQLIEHRYIERRTGISRIEQPKILCATSSEYSTLGFSSDVEILENKFPNCVTVKKNLTSKSITSLLYKEKFDIIHLVVAVDYKNGDLIFSDTLNYTKNSKNVDVDKISAKRFASLLREANTSLVVLATCDALLLAVEVSHVATMIASDTTIAIKDAIEWEDWFYGFLAMGKSVYNAFELTKIDNRAPMRLIRKKDIVFTLPRT